MTTSTEEQSKIARVDQEILVTQQSTEISYTNPESRQQTTTTVTVSTSVALPSFSTLVDSVRGGHQETSPSFTHPDQTDLLDTFSEDIPNPLTEVPVSRPSANDEPDDLDDLLDILFEN